MNNNNTKPEESILIQYFEGNISLQEKECIEKWIGESEENKKIAKDIYHLYAMSDTVGTIKSIDSQAALNIFDANLRRKERKKVLRRFQQIAAMLLIPLIGVLCYLLFANDPVEEIEVRATVGMTVSLYTPDGTKVFLNSGSTLRYPSRFIDDTRTVYLEGEGYFDVSKSTKPFVVATTDAIQVEVTGTKFNLLSYPEDNSMALTLVSGSVTLVCNDDANQTKRIKVLPDQKLVFDKKDKTISAQSGSVITDTAWKDGKIVLQNTSLEDVLKLLSRRFNTQFIIQNEKLKEYRYTGTFESQHLYRILEYLRLTSEIQYAIVQQSDSEDIMSQKQIIELY